MATAPTKLMGGTLEPQLSLVAVEGLSADPKRSRGHPMPGHLHRRL
jgi:hypothetical protein